MQAQAGIDGFKTGQGAIPNRGLVGIRQAHAGGMEISLANECDGTRLNYFDANRLLR